MWEKSCRACKQMIPGNASVCHHCRSHQNSDREWPEPEPSDNGIGFFGWILCIIIWMWLFGMILGCSTVGGTVSGAGKDLSKLGEWITQK